MSKTLFRTRRGVTFIELIGVLVVAIIIIAGALALYSEANTSSRTNQLLVAIGALTGSVRALHANTATYGGEFDSTAGTITTTQSLVRVLINANAVPPGLQITLTEETTTGSGATAVTNPATENINHAFGGRIDVIGFGQLFAISAESLDQDICIRIATESTAKASSGLRGVYVGNKKATAEAAANAVTALSELGKDGAVAKGEASFVLSNTSTSSTEGTLPIAPTQADTACEDASDNMIVWVFQ